MRRIPSTQAEVAKRAGVSQQAVSQILGGERAHLFREETRRRVRRAARALRYSPHQGAQAMRRQRSNLILFLHMGGVSEMVGRQAYHVGRSAHGEGFDYQTVDAFWWVGEGMRGVMERVIALRPEGVIVAGSVQAEHVDFQSFRAVGIPAVFMGHEEPGFSSVRYDAAAAIHELTTNALRGGARRLGLLLYGHRGAPAPNWHAEARHAGFLAAVRDAGLPAPAEYDFSDRPAAGKEPPAAVYFNPHLTDVFAPFDVGRACAEWMGDCVDALVCSNDHYALGVLTHVASKGIRIPEQLSLSGFDNLTSTVTGHTPLTSVEQPHEAMSEMAMSILLKQIRTKHRVNRRETLPCTVVWRASMPKY